MTRKRTACWTSLIVPFLLLVLWPSIAAAQPNALLYEVTETLKVKGLQSNSTAALMGTVDASTALCPSPPFGAPCSITAIASRTIDLATGMGPVRGTFSVVVELPGGASNPVDAPEAQILHGKLNGTIDLSLALFGPDGTPGTGDERPLGTISGVWSAKGVKGGPLAGVHVQGTFTGTFRLPFVLAALGIVDPSYMLDPATFPGAGSFEAVVMPAEYSLNEATVRLEVEFVAGP